MSNELRQIISAPQDRLTRKFYQEVQAREAWFYYCLRYHITSVNHQSELRRMRDEPNILGWFNRNRTNKTSMAFFWLQMNLAGGYMCGFLGSFSQNNLSSSSLPPTHYTQQPHTQYQSHLFCLAYEKPSFKVKSANVFSLSWVTSLRLTLF
ncbi:MAG: hypothetical protein V7K47_06145 [Nostoc sp.]